ncbi:hypothetical protein Fmac_011654 [Flemingia macrophylla]|uniref:VQ domain-containing protein n=1 Tax=Flemingia macrophylla TaxID=520843 RepID=A0ABD1MN18_9FABA
MLSVNNHVLMKAKRQSNKRNHKRDLKVTYISSPVKVETSASNFRALVQELTGQASNVAQMFREDDYGARNIDDGVHKEATISTQQFWSCDEEAYMPESSWLKPDYYTHLYSKSSIEPLNIAQLQYLNF